MRTQLNELLNEGMDYEEILDTLDEQTDNFTLPEGEVAFDDKYEAEVAISILKNHYENVDDAGLGILNEADESAFVIKFSSPYVDDFDFPEEEEVEESLNEELDSKNLIDVLSNDPIILLVDDIDEYSGDRVNKEYQKDYWDEDSLEEEVDEPHSREKIVVSKEDVNKVIKNIQSSPRLTILNRRKNRDLADKYNLSTDDQLNILKSISVGDYTYSTILDNALNEGNILTIFFKNVVLGEDKTNVTLYIKVDDSVAGNVVIISLHEGNDHYNHVYNESLTESNTSRVYSHLSDDSNCAIISAYRGEYPVKENKERHKELKSDVRKLGLGFIEFTSRWVEDGESFDEESLLIPKIDFDKAIKLGKKYEQASIIYKDKDRCVEICTTPFETYTPEDVVRTYNNVGPNMLNLSAANEIFERRKGGPASMPKKGGKAFNLQVVEKLEARPSYFKGPEEKIIYESKNDSLNPALWDGDELKPEVKEKLEQIADVFIKKLEEDDIPLDVDDIIIVGSNANYNYGPQSDIDLHIIADLSQFKGREVELAKKIYQCKKSMFNDKYDPMINGFEVELYVEPADDKDKDEIPDEVEDDI